MDGKGGEKDGRRRKKKGRKEGKKGRWKEETYMNIVRGV